MQRVAMANGARCVGRCSTLRFWEQMDARMAFVLSSGNAGEVLRLGKQHFEIPPTPLVGKKHYFCRKHQSRCPGASSITREMCHQHDGSRPTHYKHKIMSDGNFNRALLPSTPYRSGIKMGQQQLRIKAEAAFREVVKEKFPTLSDEELDNISEEFHKKLL